MTADGGIKNLSNNISLNKLKLSEIALCFIIYQKTVIL